MPKQKQQRKALQQQRQTEINSKKIQLNCDTNKNKQIRVEIYLVE